jgi:hypothetical protein
MRAVVVQASRGGGLAATGLERRAARAAAPLGLRAAEPPHHVLSDGDGAHLRRPAGPNAAWRRAVAAAAGVCFEWPTGGGLMRVAQSMAPGRTMACRPTGSSIMTC